MKTILKFIRFNAIGYVELVTWTKDVTGKKSVSISHYKPSLDELRGMAASKYGELTLPN